MKYNVYNKIEKEEYKMLKSKVMVVAAFLLALLVSIPAMAAENDDVNEINSVLSEFNSTVVAAYEKETVPLDAEMFTSNELYSMLSARNNYLLEFQNAVSIVEKESDFTIEKTNFIENDTAKVLAKRTIEQTLESNNQQFPFYSSLREGYILKKVDGEWKIERVIDETYGRNEVLNQFVDEFDYAQGMLNSLSDGQSIINDLSGVDYYNLPDTDDYLAEVPEEQLGSLISPRYAYLKANAVNYALQWGYGRNSAFTNYSPLDDTNFISQCLQAGGMTYTSSWKPDSYQFIYCEGQRDMLLDTGRAIGMYQAIPSYPLGVGIEGTIVHYTNGSEWYMSVIITQDPKISYSTIRVTQHDPDMINGPIEPDIRNIRAFRVL